MKSAVGFKSATSSEQGLGKGQMWERGGPGPVLSWAGKFGIYSKALLKSSLTELNLLRKHSCQVPRADCFLVIPTLELRIFF